MIVNIKENNNNNNIDNHIIVTRTKQNCFHHTDFIYIISFLLGLFFLYVAYEQFSSLTRRLISSSTKEIGESIQSIFNDIILEYQQERQNKYVGTKITLLFRIITGHFSEKIYYSISEIITRFLNENIHFAITQSIQQCQINVFDNKYIIGRAFNILASTTSGLNGEYTNCLNSFTHRNIEHVIIIQNQKLQDLLTLFKITSLSIVNFTRIGSGLILSSSCYFIYKCGTIMYNVIIYYRIRE